MTDPACLSGQRHQDNFIVTPSAHPLIGTGKKLANPDTDGNSLNRLAVRLSKNLLYLLISMRLKILGKTVFFVS
jgi:hypothetical protein